jgi:hypothetical protein
VWHGDRGDLRVYESEWNYEKLAEWCGELIEGCDAKILQSVVEWTSIYYHVTQTVGRYLPRYVIRGQLSIPHIRLDLSF